MEIQIGKDFVEFFEEWMDAMGLAPMPRDFTTEALTRIESGAEVVEMYPTGLPTLRSTYDLATRLYENSKPPTI